MGENKRRLPIGLDSFEKLREEDYYYVDKTAMIKDLINSWGEVNLFTRPRRFGKSLNMDMLRTFFEIGADASMFEGLEITKDTSLCEKYMGKFPVISMSFKDVGGSSFESAVKKLGGIIRQEARKIQFLLDSDKLSNLDKEYMKNFFDIDMEVELQEESLLLFSEFLYKHYGKKVIILIDEYDVPLDRAYQNGYYDEMVEHIRSLLGKALKTNRFLYASVITGCLRIAKESIFTGLNNFKIRTVSDIEFAEYYGFTDSEVKEMLRYYGLDEFFYDIKEWYDGYQFGNIEIYCPWDVLNYCDKLRVSREAKPEAFWMNSSSNSIIQKILSEATETTKNQIEMLISGEEIEKKLVPELTYADLNDPDINVRETYLWSVMFATGYLTETRRKENGISRLIIPNKEIQEIFRNKIQSWYQVKVKEDEQKWKAFCGAVKEGNAEKFQNLFESYMSRTISIRDTFTKKEMKENFYYGMLLGILQCDGSWVIKSNQESGEGYCDIMIEMPVEKTGCVLELKYAENGKFDDACNAALEQIEDREYTTYLRQEDMETIHIYGVACYKKRCQVVYRCEKN
ncbi:MAG: ATP-binding protein [Roseburia sp.]|nr:ATP-binding protein [Roseburia sp.]